MHQSERDAVTMALEAGAWHIGPDIIHAEPGPIAELFPTRSPKSFQDEGYAGQRMILGSSQEPSAVPNSHDLLSLPSVRNAKSAGGDLGMHRHRRAKVCSQMGVLVAVEAVELVVTALAAGAVAGMKDTASTAVKDAYAGLLNGVRRVLNRGDEGKDVSVVEAYTENPEQHREDLVTALTAAGARDDIDVIAAAQAVLAALDPQGAQAGKYTVHVKDSQGVQVGDSNTMHLKF